MQKMTGMFLAGALWMGMAGAAVAATGDQIFARIDQLEKTLIDEGYQAKIVTPEKDPKHRFVRSSSDGRTFNLFLMNCDKAIAELNCDSVQYFGWVTKGDKPFSMTAINAFNAKYRYAKAYIDQDGDAVIEMDLNLDEGGMAKAQFVDNFNIWTSLYSDFGTAMAADDETAS